MKATQSAEVWFPVVGYEGAYEVSDTGRVRSLDRQVPAGGGRTRRHLGRVMSAYSGGHYVKVRLKINGAGKTCNVHSLVAAAFIGPVPPGLEVCHNNGDNHDNRASNLRYDTHRANALERAMHGVDKNAAKTHCKNGHPFDEANTRARINGGRTCRTCDDYIWRSTPKKSVREAS